MTTDIVLHIGANKTGSSAIQAFIGNNLRSLDKNGFYVPDDQLNLKRQRTGSHVFGLAELLKTEPEQVLQRFDRVMAHKNNHKTLLVSAENLSNQNASQLFDKVCAKYRTKVILYIRRQDDLLTSSWQQWYSKHFSDIESWIGLVKDSIGQWHDVVTGWQGVAGPDAVEVRLFDRQRFPQNNIVYDFLDALGLQAKASQFKFSNTEVNPTYSDVITSLVAGNTHLFDGPHDNKFYDFVRDVTGDSFINKGPKVSLISAEFREDLIAHYAAQNENIRHQFFADQDRLFADVDHTQYAYLTQSELQKEQMNFIITALYGLYKSR